MSAETKTMMPEPRVSTSDYLNGRNMGLGRSGGGLEHALIDMGISERLLDRVKGDLGLGGLDELSRVEYEYVVDILGELSHRGQSDTLENLWKIDYKELPVSPKQFFLDDYYLGAVGRGLYDANVKELCHVLDPARQYMELICTGSIGWGKSTIAVLACIYKLYHCLCLRNPAEYYGLVSGSLLVTMFFGIDMMRAGVSLWGKLASYLGLSPYFTKKGFVNEKGLADYKIIFPRSEGIEMRTGSLPKHALSLDTVGGVLDEMEFRVNKKSPDYGSENKAYELYRNVRSRIVNRFPNQVPGLMCVVSSAGTSSGFMVRHIEKVADDPRVYVASHSAYEVAPHKYSGKTFRVEIGDELYSSRLLLDDEVAREGAHIEHVPVEHREDFDRNLDEAIQDICGVTTVGTAKLIANRVRMYECVDVERKNPFLREVIELGIMTSGHDISDFLEKEKIASYYVDSILHRHVPLVNPNVVRFVHVDMAESHDCVGLVMGHLKGFKEYTIEGDVEGLARMRDADLSVMNGKFKNRDARDARDAFDRVVHHPVVYIDLALGIYPPEGDQIDFTKVSEFLFFLRQELGFKIGSLTTDQFQSTHLRQIHAKAGVKTKTFSVDRDDKAYLDLRNAFYHGCVEMYNHEKLVEELKDLEYDRYRRRVDHTEGGSKDIADCLASVVSQIIMANPYRGYRRGDEIAVVGDMVRLMRPEYDGGMGVNGVKEKRVNIVGNDYQGRRDVSSFFKEEELADR